MAKRNVNGKKKERSNRYKEAKASTLLHISVSFTCKGKCCVLVRCRCIKNNLKCSIYCHTRHTLPEDYDCGNLQPSEQGVNHSIPLGHQDVGSAAVITGIQFLLLLIISS